MLAIDVAFGAAHEHRQIMLGGSRFDAPRQLGEERVGDVRDDHTDHRRGAGAELAGAVVGDETQLIDDRPDLDVRAFGDEIGPVDHI